MQCVVFKGVMKVGILIFNYVYKKDSIERDKIYFNDVHILISYFGLKNSHKKNTNLPPTLNKIK